MSVVANVAINVDSRNAVSQLRQVQTQAGATERAFDSLRGAAAALGVGLAFGKVIQDVKELDTNIRRLATVGVDVAKINPALAALSKELEGVASKAELAAASYQAASAGFSDTAGNIGILRAATKAAVGGLADASAVTEVLVKTLNAYGMSGRDASKVTDSISKAVEVGNQEWSDYTSQLGRVVSVSALAGVSIDQVNAFIAAATKNGATAEIAFTGLGAALQTLLQPTKESQDAAKALGIQWNIAGLQAKGLPGLLADLATKQDANKEAVARLLGSQEALRGVLSANAKAGKDYKMILDLLGGAAGKTQSDFDTMKTTLENQLKGLDTAFKNLSESLGVAFGPTLANAIGQTAAVINSIADALNAIPGPAKTATAEAIKLIAQMVLLKKAIEGIIALRAAFVAAMASMATQTTAAGAAAVTSSSAFALYTNNTRTLATQSAAATPLVAGLRAALQNLAAIGIITVGINLVVTGLQEFFTAQSEINRLRKERRAGGAAAIFGGSAPAETQEQARKDLAKIQAKQKDLMSPGAIATRALLGPLAPLAGQPSGVADQMALLKERERRAKAIISLPTRAAAGAGAGAMPTPTPLVPYTPGGGRAAGAGGGRATGASTAAQIAQALQGALGITPAQAAGIVGNLMRESGLNPRVNEGGAVGMPRGVGGYGLAQWTGPRQTNLVRFAGGAAQAGDLQTQLRFMVQELMGPESKALESLRRAQSPEEAARVFERDFERSGIKALEERQANARKVFKELEGGPAAGLQDFAQQLELQKQQLKTAGQQNTSLKDQLAILQETDLARKALLEYEIKQADIARQYNELKANAKSADELTLINANQIIEQRIAQIDYEQRINDIIEERAQLMRDLVSSVMMPTVYNELEQQEAALQDVINKYPALGAAANAAAGLVTSGVRDMIAGTKSAEQVFVDFLSTIADALIDTAKQMIAQYIAIAIARMFAGMGGGESGMNFTPISSLPSAGLGSAVPTSFTPFAEGGFVTRPTNALIGEAGEAEYVIPASKMRGAMERYANGARGDSVISGAGGGSTATTATGGGPLVVEVRAQMERINSVDYVTAEQFQAGIRQAAQQGAAQGEQRTLKRLQHSPATRRRVGV